MALMENIKIRIENIQSQINKIEAKYLPNPPNHLKRDIYEVLTALYNHKEKLVSEV